MDLSLLRTLRQKIVNGKDFSEVFEYFFDKFGENPEFLGVGEPVENELLLKMVCQFAGKVFKTEKLLVARVLFVGIKEHKFIHGCMTINDAMCSVIYCEDLQKGIIAIHRFSGDENTHFGRFSAEMLPQNFASEMNSFKH